MRYQQAILLRGKYQGKKILVKEQKPDFAFMKMPGVLFTYIPIVVRGFLNIPWLTSYQRTAIGFF